MTKILEADDHVVRDGIKKIFDEPPGTVSEIANILALSVKTISTYRARILEKVEMKTNAPITRYAIQNKLVS